MKLYEAINWSVAGHIDPRRDGFIMNKPYCSIGDKSFSKITRHGWDAGQIVKFFRDRYCRIGSDGLVIESGLDLKEDGYIIVLLDCTELNERPPIRYTRFLSFYECKDLINNQTRHIDAVYNKSWVHNGSNDTRFIHARDDFICSFRKDLKEKTVGLYYPPGSNYFKDGLPLEDFFSEHELLEHAWFNMSDPWD